VAAGVRNLCVESWKAAFGENGKVEVCRYIVEVASYYTSQSKVNNHSVREAACHCMAELCSKIAVLGSEFKDPIKPYLQNLVDALVCCFKDGCWQVRDAACVAISYFYTTFNEELQNKNTLVDMWIAHLSDNINHVRQKSAQAIAHVLRG